MQVLSGYDKAKRYISTHSSEDEESRYRRLNPGPCITLSRQTGIGGEKISQSLLEFFDNHSTRKNPWAYFDKNLIEKVLEDHNLPDNFKKFLDEESFVAENSYLNELFGIQPSMMKLFKKTFKSIYHLAELGYVIIVGRGSNIITADLRNSFHVRLVAPLNYRIELAQELYGHSRKETAEFIKREDSKRKRFIKNYFHKDVDDPLLYHVIINTNLLTFDEIANLIGNCLLKKFKSAFS
ncbi:MAG: cytidylate kinase-like family protein [Melioribacteraceae bacterium]|nr:cytidylate kinase-like family protein [Melioribacteraceae bacterium]MCF8353271.1 cytidylate kinase-like family protein [Melioribacteraceae bacterium]MCF8394843.1 cytidylate kinase-like family protein [Melioribacteraceae bacterium]MCF8418798.1 cytidylate kinase-like family protein [Melioribacteraceae bacterium]